jgi:hypothetical protein
MEPENSLPHSQEPTNCLYPEPDKSSPCPIPLLNIPFNIIPPSPPGSSSLLHSGFPNKILFALSLFPIRATCPVHLFLLDLIAPIIFGEGYSLLGSLSCIQGKERKLHTGWSQSVENSLWKMLWTCPKTDYRTMIIDYFMLPATIVCLWLNVKCQIFFRFYQNLDFLEKFSRKSSLSNFTKVRPVKTRLIHADRQTVR